jgi:hypothetical protein
MAIQASGAVSISQVQTEFGGVNPISLSEYYRNGAYIPSGATSVPTSGAIGISDFYGTSNSYGFSIAANTLNADVRALAITDGWDASTPLLVTVNAGVWCYSNTTSTGGMVLAGSFPGGVTIVNSGNIIGMGGGANTAGGPALQITTSDTVNVTNNSGAFIAGGGGGGGGSYTYTSVGSPGTLTGYTGGGGAGQSGAFGDTSSRTGGYGYGGIYTDSTIGHSCSGSTNTTDTRVAVLSRGYGYGGGGGSGAHAGGTSFVYTSGACAGRLQASWWRQGGATGGRALTGGSTGTASGNAGGFWGQAGGSGGGAGGAAISGTYVGYTNNGTVYGAIV